MVESVWWADGGLARTYPLSNEAVGEGWLVLATEEALEQISGAYGTLRRVLMAERKRTDEAQGELSSSELREEGL
jgi:hypothetical protein